jgi:hypothetical protein
MRTLLCGVVVSLATVLIVDQTGAKNLAPKSIKDVMTEAHKAPEKGKPPLCGKASNGLASRDELKLMISLYEDMAKQKPPVGEEEAFKKKSDALVIATKKLAEDPTDKEAIAGYKKAVNCAACHSVHKPKAPK